MSWPESMRAGELTLPPLNGSLGLGSLAGGVLESSPDGVDKVEPMYRPAQLLPSPRYGILSWPTSIASPNTWDK